MDKKLHFLAADTEAARDALSGLTAHYGQTALEACDIIVPLGGDGFLLECLHKHHGLGKPFYGVNKGSEGFLLNKSISERLSDRIPKSHAIVLHALTMVAETVDGTRHEAFAFNEVALFRQTRQAANLAVATDGTERLGRLVADGVMVATPAGSTAYNLSAGGPILPLGSDLLALTPIAAHRPRRWRGALLPSSCTIDVTVFDADKRPVSATADFTEIRHVLNVSISSSDSITATLLFDPDHALEERIMREQFLV